MLSLDYSQLAWPMQAKTGLYEGGGGGGGGLVFYKLSPSIPELHVQYSCTCMLPFEFIDLTTIQINVNK